MQGKVEICGVNTSRLPVLDAATTRELLLRVRRGDRAAREELIAGNLRLVLSVIQRLWDGENREKRFSHDTQAGAERRHRSAERIRPVSAEDYNARRTHPSRGRFAIAKYNHTRRWRVLLEKLDLPVYNNRSAPESPPQLKVRVISDYNFEDENPSD